MKKTIVALLLSLIFITACGSKADYKLTADQVIEKIENNEEFLLYVSNDGCGACQIFSPVYKDVGEEYPNLLYEINYGVEASSNQDSLEKLLNTYTGAINATPTVFVIQDGEVKQSFLGIMKYSELENALKNYNMVK